MAVITADSGAVTADSTFYAASGAPAISLTAQDITNIATAVLAQLMATSIPANMVRVKGQLIDGAGSEGDPWGPA